jgi:tetratricopeptide (TPR) repeat protein
VLHLLKQSWNTLQEQPLAELSRYQTYDGFVKNVLTTQSSLLTPAIQSTLSAGYPNLVESYQTFTRDVAFKACQRDRLTLSLEEALRELNHTWVRLGALVSEDAQKQFAEREESLIKASEKEKVQKERRTLLREEDFIMMMQKRRQQFEPDLPLKIRGQGYEFSHKSLFEYFVAGRLREFFDCEVDFISEKELQSLMNELVKSKPEALIFLHEALTRPQEGGLTVLSSIEALSKKVSSDKVLANIATLLSAIGQVLDKKAKYEEALVCHRQALSIREKAYDKDHPAIATCYNDISSVLEAQGKYSEALGFHKRALAIREEIYRKGHTDVARSYNNMGVVLQFQAEHGQAMEYHKQALAIREQVYGKTHSEVAQSNLNIGVVLRLQGKYTEALEYQRQALSIREQVYSKIDSDVADSYNEIGLVLHAQGKHEKALEHLLKALAIWEEVYGKEHPSVAASYNNIGQVLKDQGNYSKALENYKRSLAIREKVYGTEHPDVAIS